MKSKVLETLTILSVFVCFFAPKAMATSCAGLAKGKSTKVRSCKKSHYCKDECSKCNLDVNKCNNSKGGMGGHCSCKAKSS